MTNLVVELLRVTAGAVSGMLALSFLWVTLRSWAHGRPAYEANRKRAYPSVVKALKGEMRPAKSHLRDRTRLGMALSIASGKFVAQEQYSSEAIDEVIGRRV